MLSRVNMQESLVKITEIVSRELERTREKLLRDNFFPFHCINALSYMNDKSLYYNIFSSCWGGDRELILRGFCFGCDEGRKGDTLFIKTKINEVEYTEKICEGCKVILDQIRDTMIPVVQIDSHEGYIFWAISKSDFSENIDELGEFLYEPKSDGNCVLLYATDDGSMETLIAALVKAKFKTFDSFIIYLKDNFSLYFSKYEKEIEHLERYPFMKYSELFKDE